MEGEESGPLFDEVVLTIIPSEDLNVRLRNDVRTQLAGVFHVPYADPVLA